MKFLWLLHNNTPNKVQTVSHKPALLTNRLYRILVNMQIVYQLNSFLFNSFLSQEYFSSIKTRNERKKEKKKNRKKKILFLPVRSSSFLIGKESCLLREKTFLLFYNPNIFCVDKWEFLFVIHKALRLFILSGCKFLYIRLWEYF